MNIYQKLQKCRVELLKTDLKKSGVNIHSGYHYFELDDFLPTANEMFLSNGLCGIVNYKNDEAILTIVDTEKPESTIIFTSPMAEAKVAGCQPIQNLGAVETYQRRYLYMTALEITEGDILDKTHDKNSKGQQNKPDKKSDNKQSNQPSELEKRATVIYYKMTGNKEGQRGWNLDEYKKWLKEFKDAGMITTDYGKKWTLQDIEFLEEQAEELPF
jgi:hypothetical protein